MAYRGGIPGQPHSDYFSSHTYMWSSKDKLGQGATGQVFVGYNKKTGDKVAVKMFTRMSEFRAMQNEMHTISQLQHHKNIVQFLEINEQEKLNNTNIIVMELCNGGSLYEVIDSPENAMGLDEVQFKQVLSDVAQGLAHLKKHGFAHRDIKPGNIMRCLLPDGSYIFKLADFGTARKLGPEEKFTSLHGTEEYLYPAMYERALIDPRSQEAFVDKVDLWSVGATLFHLATGRLPFQPFRKRDDRATMYRIITEKKSGIILGWQMELNGKIFYNNELPPDVMLSVGLRNVIKPVLAGLLENNFDVMWPFSKFFIEVERIVRMKVVDVFCVSRCTCHKIYLDGRETDVMPKVRELISQQTRLEPAHMEFYFENIPYAPRGPVKPADLPDTSPDSPLTVFGGPPQKGDKLETPVLTRAPTMPPEVSIVDDLRYSKDCTKAVWGYYHSAETVERYFRLMHQAALCLRETVQKEYTSWHQKFDEAGNLYESIMKLIQGQISELHSEITLARTIASDTDVQYIEAELKKKKRLLAKIQHERHELDKQTEDFNPQIMQILNASSWDSNYCMEVFNGSIKTMKFYVDTIQEFFHQFQEQKKSRGGPQSNYDKKVHEYNKKTIKNRLAEAESRLMKMIQGRSNVYNRLYEFLQKCIFVREDMESFTTSLEHNIRYIHETIADLTEWAETHQQRLQQAAQRLKTSTPSSSSKDYSSIIKFIQDLNALTSSNLKLTEDQKQYFKNI